MSFFKKTAFTISPEAKGLPQPASRGRQEVERVASFSSLPFALLHCQVANRRKGGKKRILKQTGMDLKYAKNAPDRPLPPLFPKTRGPARLPPPHPPLCLPLPNPQHSSAVHSQHTDGPARAQDINNASFHPVDPDVLRVGGLDYFFFFINFQKYFRAMWGRVEEGAGGRGWARARHEITIGRRETPDCRRVRHPEK